MQRPCCLLSFSIFGEDEISVLVETHSQAQPPRNFLKVIFICIIKIITMQVKAYQECTKTCIGVNKGV